MSFGSKENKYSISISPLGFIFMSVYSIILSANVLALGSLVLVASIISLSRLLPQCLHVLAFSGTSSPHQGQTPDFAWNEAGVSFFTSISSLFTFNEPYSPCLSNITTGIPFFMNSSHKTPIV